MKVRLFNTFEPVTTIYRDLIPYWVDKGWDVEVIVSGAQYRSGRSLFPSGTGSTIRTLPGLSLQASSRISKATIMVLYALTAAIYSLIGSNVDRNLFFTQPPLFFVWGFLLKRIRGQPYAIVLMDIYPEVAIQAGTLPGDSSITRLLRRISRFGLRHADAIIVIGRKMAQRVREMGVDKARIHLITNWVDQEFLRPMPRANNPLRKQHGWQDKLVVLYSGNMGTTHFFDDILQVSHRLKDRPDIQFAFIGDGARRREIEQFMERHSLPNIALLPFQPADRLPESLCAADVHFVSLREGFEGLVVPSKTYGALAVGRPILFQGCLKSEIALLVQEEGIGRAVALHDPDSLERSILHYADHPEARCLQGRRARELSEGRYGKEFACARYTEVIEALQ